MHTYTVEQKLTGKFSQFVIAGAAVGVVAPEFKEWHQAFWDNLGASIQLHHIKKVIAIDHRDCGAARTRMARLRSQTRKSKPKCIRRRWRNFVSKSENATHSSVWRPA